MDKIGGLIFLSIVFKLGQALDCYSYECSGKDCRDKNPDTSQCFSASFDKNSEAACLKHTLNVTYVRNGISDLTTSRECIIVSKNETFLCPEPSHENQSTVHCSICKQDLCNGSGTFEHSVKFLVLTNVLYFFSKLV